MNCKCCNICDSKFELSCKCILQFICLRLPFCSVQPYFGNTRLMKIENAMSVISVECYLQGTECNICCCFCDVCPWAVFLLLHILFSTEQVQDFLHNLCLQGVILISVVVPVLYVHGLYLFCCIFCFLQNRSLFPCIYAYRVLMCFYMYFPFIK